MKWTSALMMLACCVLQGVTGECVVAPHQDVLGTTFRGCYQGAAGEHMLRLLRKDTVLRSTENMSPQLCVDHCKKVGAPFVALNMEIIKSNSDAVVEEFVCNCSDSPPKTSTLITGNKALTQCSKPCPNSKSVQEFCGHTTGTLVYAIDELVEKLPNVKVQGEKNKKDDTKDEL
eukprot:Lankesteria_metandrocarpae@DN5171_c2_g1_i3.p2